MCSGHTFTEERPMLLRATHGSVTSGLAVGATLVSIWTVPSPSPHPPWKIWDEWARTGKKIYRDYIAKRFTASKSRGKSLQRELIWFSTAFTVLKCCSVFISNAWLFDKKIYREHKDLLWVKVAVNLFFESSYSFQQYLQNWNTV